jgi:hypothetical protein
MNSSSTEKPSSRQLPRPLPLPPRNTKWPSGWIAFARLELEARGLCSDDKSVLDVAKVDWRLQGDTGADFERQLYGRQRHAPGRMLTPKRPPKPLTAVRRSMRAKGERLSKQRRCALGVLRRLAPGQRLTAKGLEDALRQAGVQTSTATAYRLMHWLNEHRDRGYSQ